jgi:hypothetical protein
VLYAGARSMARARKQTEALDRLAMAMELGRGDAEESLWKNPALETPLRTNLAEDEKIAGRSRLWSEVKFNFANFDLVPELDCGGEAPAERPLSQPLALPTRWSR